jgi:hypothetical protein
VVGHVEPVGYGGEGYTVVLLAGALYSFWGSLEAIWSAPGRGI